MVCNAPYCCSPSPSLPVSTCRPRSFRNTGPSCRARNSAYVADSGFSSFNSLRTAPTSSLPRNRFKSPPTPPRQDLPRMPRFRPHGLSRNRQPASLSQILEENQNHHFPRANWHRCPAFGPVTPGQFLPLWSAAVLVPALPRVASADHPRGDFLLALPRILLPLSNNPFALNARRAAFH